MKTILSETQNQANFLNFINYQLHEMNNNIVSMNSTINKTQLFLNENQVSTNQMLSEPFCLHQFKSQQKTNIILKLKNMETQGYSAFSKKSNLIQSSIKNKTKCIQKETRNINSNLFRIFFKNLIQLKVYTDQIGNVLSKLTVQYHKEQFYMWVQKFSVNFKNYIRDSIITKMLSQSQPLHFRTVFKALLRDYSQNIGLLHCLTSKRIEKKSIKMHLRGLREIKEMKTQVGPFKK